MPTQVLSHDPPIRIEFDPAKNVVLESSKQHRFLMFEHEVGMNSRRVPETRKLSEFLYAVREWSESHDAQLESTFVRIADGHLDIMFITKMTDYDPNFNDEMVDFDLELAKRFDWLRAEVMQIPGPVSESPISLRNSVQVYGDSI